MHMITATNLQNAYNALYKEVRNYIWDFDTVSALAELEVETYQAFPDMKQLSNKLATFKRYVDATDVMRTDEALKKAFDAFDEVVNGNDVELYANLKTFQEVPAI